MADLRPLTAADAPAVFELQIAAFQDLERRFGVPVSSAPADPAPALRRVRHLARTDPGGAWVALDGGGAVTGAALALIREGLWGLSLLVVRPDRQSAGIGSALLRRTLDYADGTRGGLILASEDARALRAYARAGFALRPALEATGRVTDAPAMPPGVRLGAWPRDRRLVDAASRAVRGATHATDLPNYVAMGGELLVRDAGGFAVHVRGELKVLAAHDPPAAADLLRGVLHRAPGDAEASVGFIDAAQDWAFAVVLDAGLFLRGSGAICVRGDVGPLRPYLPSGAYL